MAYCYPSFSKSVFSRLNAILAESVNIIFILFCKF